MDQLVPGATQKIIAALLPNQTVVNQCALSSPLPFNLMCDVYRDLLEAFDQAHNDAHQNDVEGSKVTTDIRKLAPIRNPNVPGGDGYAGHLGDDYSAAAGSVVVAPVSGIIRIFDRIYGEPSDKDGPFGPYGRIAAIEVTVSNPVNKNFPREGGNPRPITSGNKVTVFLGHLDPNLNITGIPLDGMEGKSVSAGDPIGYVGTFVYGNAFAGTGGSFSSGPHVHVGILPWGIGTLEVDELPVMRNKLGGMSAFPGNNDVLYSDPEKHIVGTADLIKPPVKDEWFSFFS